MLHKRPKSRLPIRKNPGDAEPEWCAPGSIEQQLDMCEEGELRGDQIEHAHGMEIPADDEELLRVDVRTGRFQILSDPDREDDEMSGDEHSSGLQGEESEIEKQAGITTGLPGEETEKQEFQTDRWLSRPSWENTGT